MPTPPRIRVNGARRRRPRLLPTRTCTGPTRPHPGGRLESPRRWKSTSARHLEAPSAPVSARDDLDFAIDAVDDVEGTLEHLAFILGNGAVFTFRQHDARECADGFLDHVATRRDYRPGGVGKRL